ncbi:hypothetical protein CRUP_007518, partial [Coryphaenoides rupestris]
VQEFEHVNGKLSSPDLIPIGMELKKLTESLSSDPNTPVAASPVATQPGTPVPAEKLESLSGSTEDKESPEPDTKKHTEQEASAGAETAASTAAAIAAAAPEKQPADGQQETRGGSEKLPERTGEDRDGAGSPATTKGASSSSSSSSSNQSKEP